MFKMKTLRETIETPKVQGIFLSLASSGKFDYINNDNKRALNIDYYEIYSRDKIASKIFDNNYGEGDYIYVDEDSNLIYVEDGVDKDYIGYPINMTELYQYLTTIIIQRYKAKWDRIYETLTMKYNPINNYDMEEIRTPNTTDTRDIKTKTDMTTDVDNDKYAFDSQTPSPSDKSKTRLTGSDDDNKTNEVYKREGNEKLTRKGNIGVTTSAQLLDGEIKARIMNNLTRIMYDDVDKVLTIPVYR